MSKTKTNKVAKLCERIARSCGEIVFEHGKPIAYGDSDGGVSLSVRSDAEQGFAYVAVFSLHADREEWLRLQWTVADPWGLPVCMGGFDPRGWFRFQLSPAQNFLLGKPLRLVIEDRMVDQQDKFSELIGSILSAPQGGLGTAELTQAIDAGQFGFRKLDVLCVPNLAAAGDKGSAKEKTDWYHCRYDHATGKVFLKIAESDVPHGLVRVVLIDTKTKKVFVWLPQLDLDSGFWFGETKLSTLRGDIPPENPIRVIAMQPADEENRAFFDNDDVRHLVDKWSGQSEQARLARTYLDGN